MQSGELSLLVDPESNRLKADVVLETLRATEAKAEDDPSLINFPGEYEIKGIEIWGVAVPEESSPKFLKTVYAVRFEDIQFVFLGHLSKMPEVKLLERIGEPDVLFVPTGAEHFLPAEAAAKLVKQLEPSLAIPSFYENPSEFLKLLGQKGEKEEKIVFKKKDLDAAQKVVLLEPKS